MWTVKRVGLACSLAVALAMNVLPTASRADVIYNIYNCIGSCGSTVVGTVDVAASGTVDAILTASGYNFFTAGSGPEIAFNVSGGPTLTIDLTTLPAAGGTWANATGSVSGNPPSGTLGTMNENITPSSHNVLLGTELKFTITAGLTSFLADDKGYTFAFDICQSVSDGACAAGANTGWAGASLSAVPLPPAALLFGTALVGMGILGRRRRKDGLAKA